MGTHPIFESDFDCLTDRQMGGSFRSYVWDPPLIIAQMMTLQCVYYGSLGLTFAVTSFLFGTWPSLSYLFDPTILHLSNKENILLVICNTVTAFNGSIALWYFVKRAKQCLGESKWFVPGRNSHAFRFYVFNALLSSYWML